MTRNVETVSIAGRMIDGKPRLEIVAHDNIVRGVHICIYAQNVTDAEARILVNNLDPRRPLSQQQIAIGTRFIIDALPQAVRLQFQTSRSNQSDQPNDKATPISSMDTQKLRHRLSVLGQQYDAIPVDMAQNNFGENSSANQRRQLLKQIVQLRNVLFDRTLQELSDQVAVSPPRQLKATQPTLLSELLKNESAKIAGTSASKTVDETDRSQQNTRDPHTIVITVTPIVARKHNRNNHIVAIVDAKRELAFAANGFLTVPALRNSLSGSSTAENVSLLHNRLSVRDRSIIDALNEIAIIGLRSKRIQLGFNSEQTKNAAVAIAHTVADGLKRKGRTVEIVDETQKLTKRPIKTTALSR